MCGIAGIIDPTAKEGANERLMHSMLDLIEHRGPDGKSVYSHQSVTLGHRRLAIIDLQTGDQPIYNEDQSICVIFNGEIFNYKELRTELESKGHQFRTESDTEVLVHLYEEEGTASFKRLNGQFAFAIHDKNEQRILLIRDHFGIKPLHYTWQNGVFLFGSEQKSMLLHPSVGRKLNLDSLHSHLNLRYTQRNETLFEGIKRLPPAHFLVYDLKADRSSPTDQAIKIEPYWSLRDKALFQSEDRFEALPQAQSKAQHGASRSSEAAVMEQMNHLMKQAVQRQLVSDVPIGVYLSGGMDSSTIVQKMHELGVSDINTFTLGFNEPTDEFSDAAVVARHFGTTHHTHSLELSPLQDFPAVIWHAEEPKINLLQGYNMSAFVKPHVSVVLGGLGGDELFAGYDIHKFVQMTSPFHRALSSPLGGLFRWAGQFKSDLLFNLQHKSGTLKWDEYRRGLQMLLAMGDVQRFYLITRNVWDYDDEFYTSIYSQQMRETLRDQSRHVKHEFAPFFKEMAKEKPLDQVLFAEFHTKMVNDYLLTEDRMAMSHSVEERVPFLDIDLVEFAFSLPADMKLKHGETKYLFRKAMKGLLPEQILQKKKWGFTVNPYMQFKKDLKQVAERILTKDFVEKQGIFNYEYIQKILNYPPDPRLRWHYNYLWVVVGLAIWQKMYIDSDLFKEREFSLEAYYS